MYVYTYVHICALHLIKQRIARVYARRVAGKRIQLIARAAGLKAASRVNALSRFHPQRDRASPANRSFARVRRAPFANARPAPLRKNDARRRVTRARRSAATRERERYIVLAIFRRASESASPHVRHARALPTIADVAIVIDPSLGRWIRQVYAFDIGFADKRRVIARTLERLL